MKLKSLRHILSYLQAALLIGLAACSDDIRTPEVRPDADFDTGISIRIPNLSRAADFARTRAEDPVPNANTIADEGKVSDNDLWLFIYSAEGNEGYDYNKAIQIPALTEIPSLEDDGITKKWAGAYKTAGSNSAEDEVKVPLYPGKYRIYMVANLHEYLGGSKLYEAKTAGGATVYEPIGEEALKAKVLDFTGKTGTSQVLIPGHLPMVCFAEDVEWDNHGSGTFDILSNDIKTLKCNLNFLCSKVRYTILFDNTPGTGNAAGFSHAEFGNYMLDFGTDNSVSNVRSNTAVTGNPAELKFFDDSFTLPLARKVYPESGTDYPVSNDTKNEKVTALDDHEAAWTSDEKKRAWQGIVYLPENPENVNDSKRTLLHLDGTVGDGGNPYEIKLIKGADSQEDNKGAALERGKFYDLTILASKLQKTELKFTIEPWTQEQLIYDLHGPYFLHIEETKVNVVPGETYKMWYDTNATELIGHAPQVEVEIDGQLKKVDLYKFYQDKAAGTFNIWINPEVKSKYFEDIKAHSSQYNFFHIQAGNIYKKVEVYPFDLDLFLTMEPEEITINVREQIASFTYSGTYDVTIRTNYDKFIITPDKWNELIGTNANTNTSDILYLTDKNGNRIPFNTEITTNSTGVMEYVLHYEGLNDGKTFWTESSHKLQLSVTAKTEDDSKTSDPKVLKINTYPSTDNYIIHVKLPSSWTSPHIYVYQALEFPADTYDPDRANKPLATKSDGSTAALEYSFTGKIAFRGWNVGGYNNPNAGAGTTSNGFYYFTDDNSWDPSKPDPKHYYELDFCETFREGTDCGSCKNDGYNRLWPGIRMQWEKDDNGNKWWKFILTGVATPGKALIMWSDTHDGTNDRRYPGYPAGSDIPDPGIPLFDYPNREGWIDLTSDEGKQNGFSPNDPNDNSNPKPPVNNPTEVTYRVYWPSTESEGRHSIHYWSDGLDEKKDGLGPIAIDGETSSGWETNYYYDITVPADATWLNVQIYRGSNDDKYVGNYNIIGHSNTRSVSGKSYQYLHKFNY